MTPDNLKELLPRLRNESFVDAANGRLLSLARIYVSLYNLVAFNSLDTVYGDRKIFQQKIDTLLRILQERCGSERDIVLHARMVEMMFSLVCGIVAPVDFKKRNSCCEAVNALVRDHMYGCGSLLEQSCLCKCLTDLLYPGPVQDGLYYPYLQDQIAGWTSGLNDDDGWPGVSVDIALERIEVLNRNSYMLLDKRYDGMICGLFSYYRNQLPVPENPANFDVCCLPMLGQLYEIMLQGNTCDVDKSVLQRIAMFMYVYSGSFAEGSDDWLYCISFVVHHLCEDIADQIQNTMLNIA